MNLRKYASLFALTGTLSLAAGCNNVIEIEPTHVLGDNNAFTKIEDFESPLNGVYANMRGLYAYGLFWSVIGDMMSDNLTETSESLVNYADITRWVYKSDQVRVVNLWATGYTIINDANVILGKITPFITPVNQKTANRIRGQALVIRALAHFTLLQYYANDLSRNSPELGIPVKTVSNLDTPPRNTVKEVYDQIYTDLNEATAVLKDVDAAVNSASRKSRLDALGASALYARVALYAKDYALAESKASEVIAAVPLATRGSFPGIWTDSNVSEVIWAVQFNSGEGGPALDVFSPAVNRAQWDPSPNLLSLYDATNDIRYASYFQTGRNFPGVASRPNRTLATKYLGKGTNRDGNINFKAFRTGEMYLIRAEARALSNKGALGLEDLNTLRAARVAGFTPGTEAGAALTGAIAQERRRELFLEGHRWLDLKRTTRTVQRQNCSSSCSLPSTSIQWTWPIPQPELDANKSVSQNPGY